MPTSYQCAICGLSSFNPAYQTTHVCQTLIAQARAAAVVQFQPNPALVTAAINVAQLQAST